MNRYFNYKSLCKNHLYGGSDQLATGSSIGSASYSGHEINLRSVFNLDLFFAKLQEEYTTKGGFIDKAISLFDEIKRLSDTGDYREIVIFFHAEASEGANIITHCSDGTTSANLISLLLTSKGVRIPIKFIPITHHSKTDIVTKYIEDYRGQNHIIIFSDIFLKSPQSDLCESLTANGFKFYVFDHHPSAVDDAIMGAYGQSIISTFTDFRTNIKAGISGLLLVLCHMLHLPQLSDDKLLVLLAFITLNDMWNVDEAFGVVKGWDPRDVMDVIKRILSERGAKNEQVQQASWLTFLNELDLSDIHREIVTLLWPLKLERFKEFLSRITFNVINDRSCIIFDGQKPKEEIAFITTATMRVIERLLLLGSRINPELPKTDLYYVLCTYQLKETEPHNDTNYGVEIRCFGDYSKCNCGALAREFGGGGHIPAAGASINKTILEGGTIDHPIIKLLKEYNNDIELQKVIAM